MRKKRIRVRLNPRPIERDATRPRVGGRLAKRRAMRLARGR